MGAVPVRRPVSFPVVERRVLVGGTSVGGTLLGPEASGWPGPVAAVARACWACGGGGGCGVGVVFRVGCAVWSPWWGWGGVVPVVC